MADFILCFTRSLFVTQGKVQSWMGNFYNNPLAYTPYFLLAENHTRKLIIQHIIHTTHNGLTIRAPSSTVE